MTGRSRSRTGLTLVELVTLIAVAAILAAIAFPVFGHYGCREGEGRTCLSNLKQLGLGMMMYAQDYDDHYPSYYPDPGIDWGEGPWVSEGKPVTQFRSSSYWIAQLRPYVKDEAVFRCPQDVNPKRNQKNAVVPGSATPFPVSYGANRMFVDPAAYGRRQPVAVANLDQPADKYLLGDCVTAFGFDLNTIAYLRYANYDPLRRQNGWSLGQFTAEGRLALAEDQVKGLSRHHAGSHIVFADGHAKWVRHDRIPNNDGPNGGQYRELEYHVVPWRPGENAGG